MQRHDNSAMRRNAQRGAWTTYCPNCKRKSALSAFRGWGRECRYCHAEYKSMKELRIAQAWAKEQSNGEAAQ